MPRRIDFDMTHDDLDKEIVFTRATLKADPDAADLLSCTEHWPARLEALHPKIRAGYVAETEADAARAVASARLDAACTAFGRDLKHAVDDDTRSNRFTQFFNEAPSQFNRQPLSEQASRVVGWLVSDDSVLVAHKAGLQQRAAEVRAALQQTALVAIVQGEGRQARAAHAKQLTAERDVLHADLVKRAAQRNLPRSWADRFFRVEVRRRSKNPD